MNDIIIEKGGFALLDGKLYRAAAFADELELFEYWDNRRFNDLSKPIKRIGKQMAEDYYLQTAFCEISDVRYSAEYVDGGKCAYRPYFGSPDNLLAPIEACSEIWLRRTRPYSDHKAENITLWLAPCCAERPSDLAFYAEGMANGSVMTSHSASEMGLKQTIESLRELYGKRIDITLPDRISEEYFAPFTLDNHRFELSRDTWDIICISPADRAGIPYIFEMVDYFNGLRKKLQT